MKSSWIFILISSLLSVSASGQMLSDATLSGKYFVRHIQFAANYLDSVTDARSITGVITFDGGGNYSFTGQQVVGQQPATSYSVSGTYSVTSAGYVVLTNPQNSSLTISARYGTEAVIGVSPTSAPNQNTDLFIAIPAPATGKVLSSQTLGVSFHIADFELTNADTAQVRVSAGSAQFDGGGNIQSFTALGRVESVPVEATQSQSSYAGTYTVNSDGTGTIAFQVPSTVSTQNALVAGGSRNLMVSASQNIFIAATPGAHDILLGIRNAPGDNVSFNGRLWSADLETSGPAVVTGFSVYGGSVSALASMAVDSAASTVIEAQTENFTGVSCSTSAVGYSAANDGGVLGTNVLWLGPTTLLLGNNGLALEVNLGENSASDPQTSGLFLLGLVETMPTLSGPAVFVNPQGIVNAATNAPVGCPIAPGEFISIYGSGLAAETAAANALPFPVSLDGVSVTINGTNAPIYSVSPGQINCIVPYELTGPAATIVVTSDKTVSNAVTVATDTTSPGIFSVNGSGFGDGAITHANGTLVSAANPAQPGEIVQMYVSGLGALTTPVPDGFGATAIDNTAAGFSVGVGYSNVSVEYTGATVDAGLYQINFGVPADEPGEQLVTISGPGSVTQQVTIYIQ